MADRGQEFTFFKGIHIRTDIRIDVSISIRPLITKFVKQLHLQDLTQTRLMRQVKSMHQDHVTN